MVISSPFPFHWFNLYMATSSTIFIFGLSILIILPLLLLGFLCILCSTLLFGLVGVHLLLPIAFFECTSQRNCISLIVQNLQNVVCIMIISQDSHLTSRFWIHISPRWLQEILANFATFHITHVFFLEYFKIRRWIFKFFLK